MILVGIIVALLLFIIIGIPILHSRYVRYLSKYLKNVPGPVPNPYIGNLGIFSSKTSDQYLDIINGLFIEYGTIVKAYSGPIDSFVIITDEKLLEAILSSNKLIEKSQEYEFLESWLGTGLLTSKGQKWKQRRRLLTPAFHFSILEDFVEVFEKVGDIFITKLEQHSGKGCFDIYPMISLLTLDIICETAMGFSHNAQVNEDSEYPKAVKKMCEIMNEKNFSLIIAINHRFYPLTRGFYKERGLLRILHSHTEAVIDSKIKKFEVEEKDDTNDMGIKKRMAFLDLLLKSTIDGKYLSRDDIKEEVDTFMFEGHDTTSSAISFALYALANHPEIQQKVLEEQHEIFGNLKAARPNLIQLNKMKYLELVIKETLRLYPSVPYFGRKMSEDFKWENITLPKGQQVLVFAYGVHRNPNNYPEPLKFIPERFEKIDGTRPYLYIPFSAGPRNCIGQKFAMLELKSTISKVIRNYELFPDKNYELKLAAELILVSKTGVRLSLKKRQ